MIANTRDYLKHYSFAKRPSHLISEACNCEPPVVSIAVPSYERTDLLIRLLLSIEHMEKCMPFEVVITEDTRSDEHIKTIKDFLASCNFKYRYILNENRLGLYPNWNQAISHCRGQYFVLVHSDDVLRKDFLKQYMPFVGKYDVVGESWKYLYLDRGSDEELRVFLASENAGSPSIRLVGAVDFLQNQLVCPLLGTLIKKTCLDKVGYFPTDEQWSTAEDLFFMVKLSLHFKVFLLSFGTYGYVIEDNMMLKCEGWEESIVDCFFLRVQTFKSLGIFDKHKIAWCYKKALSELFLRERWNKAHCQNYKKMNKKAVYDAIQMPLSLRLFAPIGNMARAIKWSIRIRPNHQ